MHKKMWRVGFGVGVLAVCLMAFGGGTARPALAAPSVEAAFATAADDYGVPVSLLKALCYMEGRLSMHGGSASIDGGYGCMHLVANRRADTLAQAAADTGVDEQTLKTDFAANLRGGAAVLRDAARQKPATLGDWYGAVAAYSVATTRTTALMYADHLYDLLKTGFSAQTDTGETVTVTAIAVTPNVATATQVQGRGTLPGGCKSDSAVDYPGALDCILDPATYDCNKVAATAPCTYEDANRPTDFPQSFVVIHDIEGTALDALNVFQDVTSNVSVHYIVDSDGTVYQVVHDTDIAYHAGNYWYNQRSIGIEHAGFDATGFQWYNATEYLASAKLTAWLLKKHSIPLDHAHIVGHSTIPAPRLRNSPNHVDPGPYWLWDYYFGLIHAQGVAYPVAKEVKGIITLNPKVGRKPAGRNGSETPANFTFAYLYNGPSTASGLIPQGGDGTDVTDVTNNVEPAMSYAYLDAIKDPAGTGDTLYKVWYGAQTEAHSTTPSQMAHATIAWLRAAKGDVEKGAGKIVTISGPVSIYGRPTTDAQYIIGDAPNAAVFASSLSVTEMGTSNLWYEISYNHREAWVPASAVTVARS